MSHNQYVMPDITAVSPGAVPVITMLCRTAKIGEIVNQMVHWNESNSKISPGLLIESLIVCIFCGRKPLWKVEEFWAKQDLKLFLTGQTLAHDLKISTVHLDTTSKSVQGVYKNGAFGDFLITGVRQYQVIFAIISKSDPSISRVSGFGTEEKAKNA